MLKGIYCRMRQPIKNQQSPVDNHQSNLRSSGAKEHQSRSNAVLGRAVVLDVFECRVPIWAVWQGHRPLGGGGGIRCGNGLGIAADGDVLGGVCGGGGQPFAGGLVVALSPYADNLMNRVSGHFCWQLFTDPVDPLARFVGFGAANEAINDGFEFGRSEVCTGEPLGCRAFASG
jgi:hypothetical protein